ncbi:MaoC domain protein dehydratase [Anaeromyxobacter sp. K]|uniref:MaoC domain protein dehydratase n=1 Tax=Anaeromyxobacter dehalogenans (strain ATCC BAA-258 / DSM 21875 / 2CP-1) TaxID=455488 RepID=B8JAJ9_ANAD2|nr:MULTISPECIES: MaoC family dehydratase N-terminal domain-containing protein [Anaeromyxobacter]ACG75357.1 MaoC domain protein dehydratase [Anaeromyxobacter sp. K]ACL67498.1 MaoC domain protein dehydratase [Anaeromyxobacter dehalogenans 2CP-1]
MLDRSLIGRESEPVVHEVERGAIRRFAEALGDPNPLYQDEAVARAAGFPALVAPPTFPAALTSNERFRHSLDLGTRSVLHGEQQLEYARPLVAGDRITVVTRVADVQERAGASGPTDVLVLEDEGRDPEGKVVFRSRETLLLRR